MLWRIELPLALQLPVAPSEIVYAVLLPAVISLVVLLIAWRPWSNKARGHWAGGLAIGAGFSVGLLGLQKMPAFPPASAEDWLFYVGILAAILGLLDGLLRLPFLVRLTLTAVAGAAVAYLVLRPVTQNAWSKQQSAIWITSITAAMLVAWWLLEFASEKLHDVTVPLLMAVAATGLGLFMMFSGSQTYGQRAGIIFAVAAGVLPVAGWSKKLSLARGGVLAFVLLFGGLLATCYAYPDQVVPYRLVLIAAAPLLGLIPALTPLRGWKRWTACVLLAAIPLGVAIVPAGIQFVHDYNAPKDDSGY